jgi:hypothetical protein
MKATPWTLSSSSFVIPSSSVVAAAGLGFTVQNLEMILVTQKRATFV